MKGGPEKLKNKATEKIDIHDRKQLEELLLQVKTPGKYIGTEFNSYPGKKDAKKFLLCFPDDYAIGNISAFLKIPKT